jgi:hypothetical protein
MSEYEQQAQDFLDKYNIIFDYSYAQYQECPNWCKNDVHTHGDKYMVTLAKEDGSSLSFDFWNSYNDARIGKEPTPYEVLSSIGDHIDDSYEEFCADFGYDAELLASYRTWEECLIQYRKEEAFFTEEEFIDLAEIQ